MSYHGYDASYCDYGKHYVASLQIWDAVKRICMDCQEVIERQKLQDRIDQLEGENTTLKAALTTIHRTCYCLHLDKLFDYYNITMVEKDDSNS